MPGCRHSDLKLAASPSPRAESSPSPTSTVMTEAGAGPSLAPKYVSAGDLASAPSAPVYLSGDWASALELQARET